MSRSDDSDRRAALPTGDQGIRRSLSSRAQSSSVGKRAHRRRRSPADQRTNSSSPAARWAAQLLRTGRVIGRLSCGTLRRRGQDPPIGRREPHPGRQVSCAPLPLGRNRRRSGEVRDRGSSSDRCVQRRRWMKLSVRTRTSRPTSGVVNTRLGARYLRPGRVRNSRMFVRMTIVPLARPDGDSPFGQPRQKRTSREA
jgi:hypothetical protein